MTTKPGKPKAERKSIAQGAPPWDSAPTPPLGVFHEAVKVRPALLDEVKVGHLRNLLPMALDALTIARDERDRYRHAAEDLAGQVAELQEVAAADARRKAVKRDYQADYRAGLRGGAAARAALRKGASA